MRGKIKNKFGSFKKQSYICSMKAEKKKIVKKKVVIEYFTDEMHKNIFLFQESMRTFKPTKTTKPIMQPIKFTYSK